MIYLGHFSFETKLKGPSRKMEPWHAKFPAVVEADNLEQALKKFHALIGKAVAGETFAGRTMEVFLETCVEIKGVPRGGLIGQIDYEMGEACTVSSVPDVSSRHAEVWTFGCEGDEDLAETYKIEPFFEVGKSKPRPPKK